MVVAADEYHTGCVVVDDNPQIVVELLNHSRFEDDVVRWYYTARRDGFNPAMEAVVPGPSGDTHLSVVAARRSRVSVLMTCTHELRHIELLQLREGNLTEQHRVMERTGHAGFWQY